MTNDDIQQRIELARKEIINQTNMFLDKNDPIMLVVALSELMLISQEISLKNNISAFQVTSEKQLAEVESMIQNFNETLKSFDEKIQQSIQQKLLKKIDLETNEFITKSIGHIISKIDGGSSTKESQSLQNNPPSDFKKIEADMARIKELMVSLSVLSSLAFASSLAICSWVIFIK